MGVDESFERWYRRLHPRIIGIVFAASGEADVAEDSADEAFTRALAHWVKVSQMSSPEAWVCRVAVNVMRRRLRRRRIEERLLGRRTTAEAAPQELCNPQVWVAVRTLPERQRLAVVLRYVGDFSEPAIAACMGVARGTVSSCLAAARANLAELLGDVDAQPELSATKETSHG